MNILYLSQYFSSKGGGGEVLFYDYARIMAKKGHNVHVICHQTADDDFQINEGVYVHKIKPIIENKGGRPASLSDNFRYIINAIRYGNTICKRNSIDIIHTNNFSPVVAGLVLSKIRKIPVITTIHDVFTTSLPGFWQKWGSQEGISRLSSYIGPIFEKLIVLLPNDLIHSVSNTTKNDLLSFGARSPIVVVPNGINLNGYDNGQFIEEYNDYVLFIGRLVFYKNVDLAINSLGYVSEKVPNIKFFIVGDGPMRDTLQTQVREKGLCLNVEFTGFISERRKRELLGRCSALLMPSTVEGFGLVILEAFAMKKPVLVADVKPYHEIVDDGTDGFMLPVHDPVKWAEKIIELVLDKKKCQLIGCMGRKKVNEKFNILKSVELMESVYRDLINRKHN